MIKPNHFNPLEIFKNRKKNTKKINKLHDNQNQKARASIGDIRQTRNFDFVFQLLKKVTHQDFEKTDHLSDNRFVYSTGNRLLK